MCHRRLLLGMLAAACLSTAAAARDDSPLADAAERRDRARVESLLSDKAAVNQAQPDGMTALHWAAHHDDVELARRLLAAGADVRLENRYGVAPLPLACENGNGELVELLLKSGADPNTKLRGGETALMTAARTGRLAPVKALLAAGADVNAKERKGQTAIMWAAAEGHVQVVQALLDAKAEFTQPLASGFTPLLFAVRAGHADVVQLLLTAGADVTEAAASRRLGGGGNGGISPLLVAVENGHFEMALSLVKAGADPNDQRSGFAPLHALVAVRKPNRGEGDDGDPAPRGSGSVSSPDFVRELVKLGADVNLRLKRGESGGGQLGKSGATPLLLAAFRDDVPLIKLLVELGADPLIANADGCTPLLAAAGVGTRYPGEEAGTEAEALETVALLLELGSDINAVDRNGESAMHGAAYKSMPKMVQLLADKGAKIDTWNKTNKHGWTPLHIALGYRFGNFKPAAETIAAMHKVMLAGGLTPTNEPPKSGRKDY